MEVAKLNIFGQTISDSNFYLMCVLNGNAPGNGGPNEESKNDLLQLNSPEEQGDQCFKIFVDTLAEELKTVDQGRLAQSLSLKLKESMQKVNFPNGQSSLIDHVDESSLQEEAEDQESKAKLKNIEIELEDIA